MGAEDEWYQDMLVPPRVVEVRLRIGAIVSEDHIMVQVESVEPVTRVQLSMWSTPHRPLSQTTELLEESMRRVKHELRRLDVLGPFD